MRTQSSLRRPDPLRAGTSPRTIGYGSCTGTATAGRPRYGAQLGAGLLSCLFGNSAGLCLSMILPLFAITGSSGESSSRFLAFDNSKLTQFNSLSNYNQTSNCSVRRSSCWRRESRRTRRCSPTGFSWRGAGSRATTMCTHSSATLMGRSLCVRPAWVLCGRSRVLIHCLRLDCCRVTGTQGLRQPP